MRLPRISQTVDHFCVEGWNARAEWSGVRVSDLARALQLDVTNQSSIAAAAERIRKEFGRLDVL